MSETDALRLDRWLWHARFIKQRTLAGDLVRRRRIRINERLTSKVHQLVRVGDVLTLTLGTRVVVVRIVDLGQRRGPASEAQALYEEIVE